MPLDETPSDIARALAANPAAKASFERLADSHKREYLLWVEEAKKPETRVRRIARMLKRLEPAASNEHHDKA